LSQSEDTTYLAYYVVCLIDVLGQKQKLAAWPELPVSEGDMSKLMGSMKETLGTVVTLREMFLSFFQEAAKCINPDLVSALSEQDRERYERFADCNVGVQWFSDTFVFFSAIPNQYGDIRVGPLYRILIAACMAMVVSLAGKVPLRGAITIGPGVEIDQTFYGPALSEAYHLESEVAKHPRILVSDEVLAFLRGAQHFSKDSKVSAATQRLAAASHGYICQDVDGCWMVDFLGESARELFTKHEKGYEAARAARSFVQAEAERFRETGPSKLALRYHLVQQYVESRLDNWDLEEDQAGASALD